MSEEEEGTRETIRTAREASELLERLRESLARAGDKNDSLLEAVESIEARASEEGGSELPLLRNLRARLAACHAPNSVVRRDLASFAGQFEKQWRLLEERLVQWQTLSLQLCKGQRELEDREQRYEKERRQFEEKRLSWQQEVEQARRDILEQNDRLTLLSQHVAGSKELLEVRSSELASQRIAFEEEKLAHQTGQEVKGGEVKGQMSESIELQRKLKEQVLKNVELERALLKAELSLHQRSEVSEAQEGRVRRLEGELQQARLASSRAVKQFERRTTEANKKLAQMNTELTKAQEHARRFQDMLNSERRRQKGLKHALEQELQKKGEGQGAGLTAEAQRAYVETLTDSLSPHNKTSGTTRIDDVIRKNEAVLVENRGLRAEVRRLRVENSDLLRQVRFANNNAHYMRNQAVSNLTDRAELIRRLDKAEIHYKELEQSLTQQASEWVSRLKRDNNKKTIRWAQIEPVPVLGASERTWSTPNKQHPQSRPIPVHRW